MNIDDITLYYRYFAYSQIHLISIGVMLFYLALSFQPYYKSCYDYDVIFFVAMLEGITSVVVLVLSLLKPCSFTDENTTTGYEKMLFPSFLSMLSYNLCILQICCGLAVTVFKVSFNVLWYTGYNKYSTELLFYGVKWRYFDNTNKTLKVLPCPSPPDMSSPLLKALKWGTV